MRHPLVMGNWKLNGSRHMVNELVANLRTELAGVSARQKAATFTWARRTLT